MRNQVDSYTDATKERTRQEISAQVEEFLKKGYLIDILRTTAISWDRGSVWHRQEELSDLYK